MHPRASVLNLFGGDANLVGLADALTADHGLDHVGESVLERGKEVDDRDLQGRIWTYEPRNIQGRRGSPTAVLNSNEQCGVCSAPVYA